MKFTRMIAFIVGALALSLGSFSSTAQGQCVYDGNNDGVVDGADLAEMLGQWGSCGSQTPSWATLLVAAPDPAIVTDPALRAAIVASGWAWKVRDNSSNIEMLLVPAGSFTMGCKGSVQYGCQSDENPLHTVTLANAFYTWPHGSDASAVAGEDGQ